MNKINKKSENKALPTMPPKAQRSKPTQGGTGGSAAVSGIKTNINLNSQNHLIALNMIEEFEKFIERTIKIKWSLLSVILVYTILICTFVPLSFSIVEFCISPTDSGVFYFFCITIINFIFPIVLWKWANYHFDSKYKKVKNFCSTSLNFSEDYENIVQIDKDNGSKYKKSDLWYLFINTRRFQECKEMTSNYLRNIQKDREPDNTISNVEMWSLLGASELLIKFRSSVNLAQKIEKDLLNILGRPIPVNKDWFDTSYEASNESLLESTHKNKKGIQLINCTYERLLNKKSENNFEHGKLIYTQNVNHAARSMKTFIKFHFDKYNTYDESKIRDVLPHFKETVELMATCENQEIKELKFIIIEAHYPCGRFSDLFKLSEELENYLGPDLVKETYIAYVGGLLFGNHQLSISSNGKN